jgi:hypothetical protein
LSSPLPYVYVAILDILGYRYHLQEDKRLGVLEFKDALQNSLQVLSRFNEADLNYQAISDTIIIICPNQDKFIDFLNAIKTTFLSFLCEGLFLRGGIAYSQHFKSTHITYSHSIARAHQLENSDAIYPRVIIDYNIIDMFKASEELSKLIESNYICVHNGMYFLNILDASNWKNVFQWSRQLYLKDIPQIRRKEHEFIKHAWFENYLFSSEFKDNSFDRYISSIQQLKMEDQT